MSGVHALAWCALTDAGNIAYFDGRPMLMPGAVGNEHHPTPLYPQATVDTLRAQLEAAEARHTATERDACQQAERANEYRDRLLAGSERAVTAEARAEAAEAECARLREDAERMDWLVSHSVEVRYPLRHGSRHLFHAQQLNDECDEHETDLRAQIDAARTKEETK